MRPAFSIRLLFIFFILSGLASPLYPQDTHQSHALAQLRREIAVSILQRHSSPIQSVLKRHKMLDATTFSSISNNNESEQTFNFLPKNRPPKVSQDEWQAFTRSDIGLEDAENGIGSFTLLDLNEDGLRDLIVNRYIGGTGLYSYVSVYRRLGRRFVSTKLVVSSAEASDMALYSINGRGSDQEADWIRINGRVYLAYRNGEYGKDELILLRAFSVPVKKVRGLVVEYRYRHTLLSHRQNIEQDINKPVRMLDAKLYAAIQKGLSKIQTQAAQEQIPIAQCAVPINLPPEKQEQYATTWFGAGHYTFDIVADFPVYEGNHCYEVRLVSFKSSYLTAGLYMATALWLLRSPDSEQEEYKVHSSRFPRHVQLAYIEYPFQE